METPQGLANHTLPIHFALAAAIVLIPDAVDWFRDNGHIKELTVDSSLIIHSQLKRVGFYKHRAEYSQNPRHNTQRATITPLGKAALEWLNDEGVPEITPPPENQMTQSDLYGIF